MTLKGKQKRVLRSLGQLLDPVVFIGKEGISAATVASTEEVFRRRELIKVRVLNTAPDDTAALAAALAKTTGSELAGTVGHTFLLYRKNPTVREPIELPA
ncbi:MAG TPA: YhbY family RNA-binding protein [Armatimonadota bacterium]|nr:YhbY family RNA-binding protein [Armatimonadota bacterium]